MKHRKRWILGILGLGIVIITIWLIALMHGPATGQITVVSAPGITKKSVPVLATYRGHYITFKYPGAYQPAVPPSNPSSYLETVVLTGSGAKQLTVSVRPTEVLANDPNVQQHRNGQYRQGSLQIGSDEALIFTKLAGSFEQTAYLNHGPYFLTISMSDPNGNDDTPDFSQVATTLQWLQ